MQNSPIQLGSINLQDFEVPQSLHFGGRYRVAVHTLAGGRRIVERLGPDDDDIHFSGTFSGPSAEIRARAFDNLRLSGEIVWLTWESFRRQVVVRSFTAEYNNPWWISYHIVCTIVHQTQIGSSAGSNVAATIASDLSYAVTNATNAGLSLTALSTALGTPNAMVTGTADQAGAIAEVGSALGSVNGQIDEQSTSVTAASSSDTSPSIIGQSYVAQVNSAQSLAAAATIRGYIGRIGMTLGAISV